MPPLKSPPIKPDKSMLFFHIWNANFSVTSINSQIYMTKPKQAKKELSENTGTTFSAIMPPFTSRGGGIIAEITVLSNCLEYDKLWDLVMKAVPKVDGSESGQMVLKLVK